VLVGAFFTSAVECAGATEEAEGAASAARLRLGREEGLARLRRLQAQGRGRRHRPLGRGVGWRRPIETEDEARARAQEKLKDQHPDREQMSKAARKIGRALAQPAKRT